MMDADFDFGVGDSHGTSVGDVSNSLKLSSLDGKLPTETSTLY